MSKTTSARSPIKKSRLTRLPGKILRGAFWTAIMAHLLVRTVAARGDEAIGAEIIWEDAAAPAEVWAFEPEVRRPLKPRPGVGPGRPGRPGRPPVGGGIIMERVKYTCSNGSVETTEAACGDRSRCEDLCRNSGGSGGSCSSSEYFCSVAQN